LGLSSFPGVSVISDFDALIDRETAACAAKVTPSAVAMWVSRGWLDPQTGDRRTLESRGRDWQGRHLYRYSDVMAAERATRRTGRPRNWSFLNVNSSGMTG
jgi:hypothetical protein